MPFNCLFTLYALPDTPKTEEQRLLLAEEFFRFILEVVTNRSAISPENALRKQVIQWLAAGDRMTHSTLIKQITYEKLSNKGAFLFF